jgi:iduronate 2-sulfatase
LEEGIMKLLPTACIAFGLATAACLAAPATTQSSGAGKRPLNVLLVISDDLNTSLACYGCPVAKTPNVDRLAARGVRFERAYCQYPLCNPSRSSFMTGRRPETTGVMDNGTRFREKLPDVLTMPQLFQKAGYFAARVGKIYHYGVPGQIGTDGLDDTPSWELRINPRGRDKDDEDEVIQYTGNRNSLGSSLCYLAADGTDLEQTDGKIATETIRLMETHRDRPFFLACGFFRPHVPCIAPKAYFNAHPLGTLTLPASAADLAGYPAPALTVDPPNYGLTHEQLTNFLQSYHACVTFMDAQVGRLMEALDRLGLRDDTVVVFLGDHGWLLGEHGQWQKMSLFEESTHVPLIISAPGMKGAGQASGRTVELIDIYATVAALAGVEAPGAEGASLVPLLNDPQAKWTRAAYTVVGRGQPGGFASPKRKGFFLGRTVRNERYRYTEWDEGRKGAELYDHDKDPKELRNLAADTQQADTVAEMKRLLHAPK